ncbi:Smt3-specific protease [Haplosporangium sp. Z 27]|nr:Smt3-specific protease [Haplosporangium sp. Z 27]
MRPDLRVISKERLQTASSIPPLSEVQKACKFSSSSGDQNSCVSFSGYGVVPASLLPSLRGICQMMAFAESLRAMDEWLDNNCDDEFQAFSTWLRTIFQHERGIDKHTFKPEDASFQTHIREILCLKNEDYITDEIIKNIFAMFGHHYGSQYLYIDPCAIQDWIDNFNSGSSKSGKTVWFPEDFGRESIRLEKVLKVFSLVHINRNHWGVLVVDFKMKVISFGDSLDSGKMRAHKNVAKVIQRWLKGIGAGMEGWGTAVQHHSVPQQPHKSGSCGIIALNAIERIIDPSIEEWRSDRSSFHRVRYLKTLIEGHTALTNIPTNTTDTEFSADVSDNGASVDIIGTEIARAQSSLSGEQSPILDNGRSDFSDDCIDIQSYTCEDIGQDALEIRPGGCRNDDEDDVIAEGDSDVNEGIDSGPSARARRDLNSQVNEDLIEWVPVDKSDVGATRKIAEN